MSEKSCLNLKFILLPDSVQWYSDPVALYAPCCLLGLLDQGVGGKGREDEQKNINVHSFVLLLYSLFDGMHGVALSDQSHTKL